MKAKKIIEKTRMTDAEIQEAIRRDKAWMDDIDSDEGIVVPKGALKNIFGNEDDESEEVEPSAGIDIDDEESDDAEGEDENCEEGDEDEGDDENENEDDDGDGGDDDDNECGGGSSGVGGVVGAIVGGIGGIVLGGILGAALFDD